MEILLILLCSVEKEEVDFKGYKALYIMGVYSNDKENLGGPFSHILSRLGKNSFI